VSPDNLADPQGYQRHLVGLVGYDDPAAVQASTIAAWRALVAEAGPDLRTANLALLAGTTPATWARTVRHPERGPESLRLMFTITAGHDRFHLAQARRALAAVRPG
jgi:hypothetical protein